MTFIQKVKDEISERRENRKDYPALDADALSANRSKLSERKTENEIQQYVADIFLTAANGTIKHGYQIDFSFENLENAQGFCEILAAYDIFPKLTHRGDLIIVYIKSKEDICNLLALVGASKSLLDLNNEIALRELRSSANRRANCDSGNIAKQVATAGEQIEHIKMLNLEELEPKLRDVACARIDNPNATYEELASALNLTKSGLVHRIRKLMAM